MVIINYDYDCDKPRWSKKTISFYALFHAINKNRRFFKNNANDVKK